MCFSKSVAGAIEADCIDVAFLDQLTSAQQETMWLATIQLNGKQTPFKLDTGAEVTAISSDTHQHLGRPVLTPPDKTLYGPSRQALQVVGMSKGAFTHKGRQSQQQVYVVKDLKRNLLGLPAITTLNLAARIDVTTTKRDFPKEFPKVFKGLGNLGEEFTIQLKPNATPHALFTT